jgi:hypothetical protein
MPQIKSFTNLAGLTIMICQASKSLQGLLTVDPKKDQGTAVSIRLPGLPQPTPSASSSNIKECHGIKTTLLAISGDGYHLLPYFKNNSKNICIFRPIGLFLFQQYQMT